jgi:hypothetical protein
MWINSPSLASRITIPFETPEEKIPVRSHIDMWLEWQHARIKWLTKHGIKVTNALEKQAFFNLRDK